MLKLRKLFKRPIRFFNVSGDDDNIITDFWKKRPEQREKMREVREEMSFDIGEEYGSEDCDDDQMASREGLDFQKFIRKQKDNPKYGKGCINRT